jgi:hypothetical protein
VLSASVASYLIVEAPGTADGLLRRDERLVCLASRRSDIRRLVSLGGSGGARSGVDFRGMTVVMSVCRNRWARLCARSPSTSPIVLTYRALGRGLPANGKVAVLLTRSLPPALPVTSLAPMGASLILAEVAAGPLTAGTLFLGVAIQKISPLGPVLTVSDKLCPNRTKHV